MANGLPLSELLRFVLLGCLAGIVAILTSAWYQSRHAGPPSLGDGVKSATASANQSQAGNSDPSSTKPRATITLPTTAISLTTEGLQAEAEKVTGELLSRFPDLPEAIHVKALLHARLRQSAQAVTHWKRCVELAPGDMKYRLNLAAIAMECGNNELAAETLLPVATSPKAPPDITHHLALALTSLGRTDEAVPHLQRTLAQHPQSTAHWLVLGQAQLKQGLAAEAETSLRKAMELGGQSPELFFALASACARNGKADDAAQFRQQFAELKAEQPLAAQDRFQVLSGGEARQTTLTLIIEAAAVHSLQRDSLEAERLLLRALALDPGNVVACRALAKLYGDEHLVPEQRVVYERLIQIEPLHVDHYRNLAQLAAQLDDPEAAEAALKMAISIQPDFAPAYTTLAQFCLQEGKASKARWYAQEAVRRHESAQAYLLLASTCRSLGDEATAEVALAKAKELGLRQSRDHSPKP